MIATHSVQAITFDEDKMYLTIDGQTIGVPLAQVSQKLAKADTVERSLYKISPSGYGIHWPLLDEDLSIAFISKLV